MGCGSSVPATHPRQEKLIASLTKTVNALKKRVEALEAATPKDATGLEIVAVTPPEPVCVCDAGARERAKFLSDKWIPYLQDLKAEYMAAATRYIADFNQEEIFPPQRRIEDLADRCAALTKEWHGERNYSTIYEWLIELHEVDQSTYPYRFHELPVEHSEDGWIRIIDGKERRSKYVETDADHDEQDVLPQAAGDTPIDNTVLGNVVTAEEGHMLLAGGMVRQVFLKAVASKQTAILTKFSKFFAEHGIGMEKETWSNLIEAPPDDVKDALEHGEWRPDLNLIAMGISDESVAWNFLKRNGYVVESFHQLSKAERAQVQEFLRSEFMPSQEEKANAVEQTELDQFVAWAKGHPGQWWKGCKKEHEKLLILAMLSPKYAVLKRSAVERFTHHRFFVIPWKRQVPLITVDEQGNESILREAGAKEHSRIRKNKYPYMDSHGLALSSGGLVERADLDEEHSKGNLMFELAMPVDARARLGNLWLSDVEKLLHEVALLNACKPLRDRLLPCEVCHEAGQNPAASSSIGKTQHMQLGRSSVQDWPLMQMQNKPVHVEDLDATLDLVQVGDKVDAFLLRFKTAVPVNIPLINAIQDIRLAMMREFGGHQVDFNVLAMPDTAEGDFVVTFAPIAAMREDAEGCFNDITKERTSETPLPRSGFSVVDSSQGKGNGLLYSIEDWVRAKGTDSGGRKLLEALYDYNAVPGARRFLRSFLLKRYGFIDNVYGKAKGPAVAAHQRTFKTPIFGRNFEAELGTRTSTRQSDAARDQHRDSTQRASRATAGHPDDDKDDGPEGRGQPPGSRPLTEAEHLTPPSSPKVSVVRRWNGPRDGFGSYVGLPESLNSTRKPGVDSLNSTRSRKPDSLNSTQRKPS